MLNGGAGLASPVEAVGDIARAMIVAAPGQRLMIGDFSGVESRVIAWISGQLSKLEQWAKFDRTGALVDDPYYILGRACGLAEDIARPNGKICDLAFGYQGGIGAWKAQAPKGDPSTDADIKSYQLKWKAQHPFTVAFWKGIDSKAIAAVRTPGRVIEYKRMRIVREGDFLRITLPSGRDLSYPFPRIITEPKYGQSRVVFKDASMGKWTDCNFGDGAYGGLWSENIVSAIARDLLAGAMMRLEAAGYHVVLTVHDEVVCEVPDGFSSLNEFKRLLTAAPDWVTGVLPIAAKVRESTRFSKPDAAPAPERAIEPPTLETVTLAPAASAPTERAETEHAVATPVLKPVMLSREKPAPQPEPVTPAREKPGALAAAVLGLRAELQGHYASGDAQPRGEVPEAPPIAEPREGPESPAGAPGEVGPVEGPGLGAEPLGEPSPGFVAGNSALANAVLRMRGEIPGLGDADEPKPGNGRGNGHDGGYPHGEQRTGGGRQVATYLYLDHLGGNHTRITKRAATASRRAQYPQDFWVDGRWVSEKPEGWLKIPYRLPELLAGIAAGRAVFIPEGEKDCDTLVELNFIATTIPKAPRRSMPRPASGCRN